MSELVKLPDACRIDMHFFVTSDKTGLEAVVSLKHLPAFVMPKDDGTGALEKLPDVTDDWRLMTKAEVRDYLRGDREDNDSALIESVDL